MHFFVENQKCTKMEQICNGVIVLLFQTITVNEMQRHQNVYEKGERKMMKKTKIFILLMGVLLVLGSGGCGKKTLENVIVGKWQDPEDGSISCFYEDGSYELNGEEIGYYSAEKNHLEIYLYDSRIPATKLYGDVELNGDDYFSGYFVLENEDGEIVDEDNSAFARLGGNTDSAYAEDSYEEDSYEEDSYTEDSSSDEAEIETISSGNLIRDIVVGTWWDEEDECHLTFGENGDYLVNDELSGSYSVDGNTIKIEFLSQDPEGINLTIKSFSAVHLTVDIKGKDYSLSKED